MPATPTFLSDSASGKNAIISSSSLSQPAPWIASPSLLYPLHVLHLYLEPLTHKDDSDPGRPFVCALRNRWPSRPPKHRPSINPPRSPYPVKTTHVAPPARHSRPHPPLSIQPWGLYHALSSYSASLFTSLSGHYTSHVFQAQCPFRYMFLIVRRHGHKYQPSRSFLMSSSGCTDRQQMGSKQNRQEQMSIAYLLTRAFST